MNVLICDEKNCTVCGKFYKIPYKSFKNLAEYHKDVYKMKCQYCGCDIIIEYKKLNNALSISTK